MPTHKKVAVRKPTAKKAAARSGSPKQPAAKKNAKAAARQGAAGNMPQFTKAPPKLVALFEQVVAGLPPVEIRKMFGYPAAFANGQMFASLFQDHFILRLPEGERAAFIHAHGAHVFEPMPGRPMREYVEVPPALLKTGEEFDGWLAKGLAYAQSLPPKAAKTRRK
jgi:TfoX/Sxy family transcriptional regulator of competence genes